MTLYIAVTADALELPCFVAESPAELARMLNMLPTTVRGYISRRSVVGGYRFGKVECEE